MERSSVSTGVRKPGKHGRCAGRRDMTIAVKNGVNPQNKQRYPWDEFPTGSNLHVSLTTMPLQKRMLAV